MSELQQVPTYKYIQTQAFCIYQSPTGPMKKAALTIVVKVGLCKGDLDVSLVWIQLRQLHLVV